MERVFSHLACSMRRARELVSSSSRRGCPLGSFACLRDDLTSLEPDLSNKIAVGNKKEGGQLGHNSFLTDFLTSCEPDLILSLTCC